VIDCCALSDDELVRLVREAASAWFNNKQLLLLEELIRRAMLGRAGVRDGGGE
jgi:hypothetical protein